MNPGDVVVIALPRFATGGRTKRRPCLVLASLPGGFQSALVCGISSEVDEIETGWDDLIQPADADFRMSGLVKPSSIRLSYLYAVDEADVIGRIGDVSERRLIELVQRLAAHLTR